MESKSNFTGIVLLFCGLALSGCAMEPTRIAESKEPISVPAGVPIKSIYLSKVVTHIPLGERVLNVYYSWWRQSGISVDWRGGRLNLTDAELADSFCRELEQSKYPVMDTSGDLFSELNEHEVELLVAAAIEKVQTNIWYPFSSSPSASFGNTSQVNGGAYMQVRWQIYSYADKKIVYETTTEGSFKSDGTITSGITAFLKEAFSSNVRNLLADPAFLTLVRADSSKGAI
jgi:hypothetical protein